MSVKLLLLVSCAWLAACGGRGAVLERLDEQAGLVLTQSRTPLVFARGEPRYSRSARDYLYLGPVETNRQGLREYFLWVGVASTLDRGFLAPQTELPDTLYVTIGEEPIELPLKPWRELVRADSRGSVYRTAVPVRTELGARVTLQQLALLDREILESVSVAGGERGAVRTYARWGDGVRFDEFLRSAAGGNTP